VQKAVKHLLDAVKDTGRMDVMRDLATPLPVLVIAEMMGVPEPDRPYIRQLAQKLLYIFRGERDRMKLLTEGMKGMIEYVSPLVDERIANPGDDFISVLASGEKKGIFFTRQIANGTSGAALAGHVSRARPQPGRSRRASPLFLTSTQALFGFAGWRRGEEIKRQQAFAAASLALSPC